MRRTNPVKKTGKGKEIRHDLASDLQDVYWRGRAIAGYNDGLGEDDLGSSLQILGLAVRRNRSLQKSLLTAAERATIGKILVRAAERLAKKIEANAAYGLRRESPDYPR